MDDSDDIDGHVLLDALVKFEKWKVWMAINHPTILLSELGRRQQLELFLAFNSYAKEFYK